MKPFGLIGVSKQIGEKGEKKKRKQKSDSRFGISRQETVIIPVPTALYYVCNADSMARNLL